MTKLFICYKTSSSLLLMMLFVFFSCQNDESIVIKTPSNVAVITDSGLLTRLLSRVVQNPTTLDNVLDHSSCISIQLPVIVVVNSQSISVSSKSDYQLVKNNISTSATDDDLIHFSYPITVNFHDFTSQVVDNKSKLDEIILNCSDDDDLDDISCLTINYPISIAIYDTNSQLASTKFLYNNTQFFSFITNDLHSNIVASINYPISIKNKVGENTFLNSNSEFENFIQNSIGDCVDGNIINPAFEAVLTSSEWYISQYKHEYNDQTTLFTGYSFNFNANKNSSAIKNSVVITGTWTTELEDGSTKLELHYAGETLEKLEEDWKLIEFSNTLLKLRHDNDYLTFTKI